MELAKLESIDRDEMVAQMGCGGFVVIHNRGDSMEKLIMDGSKVVVDTTKNVIQSGSVYALYIPWEGFVLRECYCEKLGIVLRPYNENYPLSTITWENFDPEMIIGKVFCSMVNVFR